VFCFGVFDLARKFVLVCLMLHRIKCQVLPILDVLRLQYLFGVVEIYRALFSARFFIYFFVRASLAVPLKPEPLKLVYRSRKNAF
jgi:hypothetical protein